MVWMLFPIYCLFTNMSRVWFLADTHFGLKNDKDMWLDDFTNYFNDVVIPLMRKEYRDGDILVHLGDVFDNRSVIGIRTICKTIDIFEKFSEIFKDIRIIVGNHDIYNKSSNDVTSIKMLERIPNVTVYKKPSVEVIDGKTILFNPWVNELEPENKLLASVNVDYIFGHLDVSGCQLNKSGSKSMSENSIDSKNFKNSVVYAGHIHKRQDFKNVHYVGTPYQMTRNEMGDINGITVLDVASGETTFFENKYSPRFKKVSIYEILNKTVGELKEDWKNYFVDLHIKGSDYIVCKFDTLTEELMNYFKEFNIHSENNDDIIDTSSTENGVEKKSAEGYVDDWLNDNDIDENRMKVIKELYSKYKEKI